ncbi:hypothetical protein H3146_05220 [Streptomyces sp. OF3]|uniref:Secreted protein n=1 Tax=Streptomyces alkaliterrae TaxID=2213162 RepID=A0A7W3WI23_9ACTN|nr:hypothetical protein [Streptomyces alkaliterrae]MBB1252767.1 hypothetical protein [Streptomyces alkaliterrae]
MVAAVALVATGQTPAQAATAPSLGDYELRPATNQAELIDRVRKLDDELPRLGVQNILGTANRTAVQSASSRTCNPDAVKSLQLRGVSYCFDGPDSGKQGVPVEWMPQGITTVADAQDDQLWGSKRAILTSWYDKSPADGGQSGGDADKVKGCRVTFLDPDTLKYRHVLLAYPYINSYGNPTYMSLRTTQKSEYDSLHCGGMTWYGNYLYVADTARGFRVFDMRYIFDLETAENGDIGDKSRIGRHSGVYHAHGYRFVMPQVAAWTNTTARQKCTVGGGSSFSFVGLDRSGVDHLTTGEFCGDKVANGDPDKMGRVARWPLDGATGRPALSGGLWKADAAYRLPISNIQGAVSYNGIWYLSRSQGQSNGVLYATRRTTSATGTLEIASAHRAGVGVEDLSHWPTPSGGPGKLWTVTEYAGKRLIYACEISALNDPARNTEICGPWSDPPQ